MHIFDDNHGPSWSLMVLTLKKLYVLTQDVLRLVPLYDLNVWSSSWDVGDKHITWWQKQTCHWTATQLERKNTPRVYEQEHISVNTRTQSGEDRSLGKADPSKYDYNALVLHHTTRRRLPPTSLKHGCRQLDSWLDPVSLDPSLHKSCVACDFQSRSNGAYFSLFSLFLFLHSGFLTAVLQSTSNEASVESKWISRRLRCISQVLSGLCWIFSLLLKDITVRLL